MVKKNIKKNIKKINKKVDHGQVHIQASFNNTIVTITDTKGNVLAWSSAGKLGFKGSKKSTSYAAQMASESATKDSLVYGLNKVDVFVKGPGQGREVAIRAVETNGLKVLSIKDVTPIPHNGCRPPKKRRI